jgi:hypothetical protein
VFRGALPFVNEVYQRADAFLFGRRTYEVFAGYWGVMDPGRSESLPVETRIHHRVAGRAV